MVTRVSRSAFTLLIGTLGAACQGPPRALLNQSNLDFGSVSSSKPPQCLPPHAKNIPLTLTVESPYDGMNYHFAMSPGAFEWVVDTMFPQTFPKGTSTWNVSISFFPTYTGDQKALAAVVLHDPKATSTVVDLKGRGTCDY